MPATPAWPPKSLPRLFVRAPLIEGALVELDANQANYLGNVMRLGAGAEVLLFDGSSGEWLARIAEATKKRMRLAVEQRTREPESIPDVWLAFAPVKRAGTDWLVEKATELGAARLVPVITQRTVAERVRLERLEAISIEAAEQCGRTRLPQIAEPVHLRRFVEEIDSTRHFYFADESGGEPAASAFGEGPAVILIGPEEDSRPKNAISCWAAVHRRSRSGLESSAPRRPPWPRSPVSWQSSATGRHKLDHDRHKAYFLARLAARR